MAEEPKWHQGGLVLICSRCHVRANPSDSYGRDIAETQRKQVKALMMEKGLLPHTRPVSTSCLGICPEKQLVVSHIEARSGVSRTEVLPLNASADEILKKIGL